MDFLFDGCLINKIRQVGYSKPVSYSEIPNNCYTRFTQPRTVKPFLLPSTPTKRIYTCLGIFFGRIDMKTEEKLGKDVKFERIRRITGYISGDTSSWNNAKRAEEKDRVKHKWDILNSRRVCGFRAA